MAYDFYDVIFVDTTSVQDPIHCVVDMHRQAPDAKIVVMAGSADWRTAREVFRAGALDYLSFSLPTDELRTVINNIIKL